MKKRSKFHKTKSMSCTRNNYAALKTNKDVKWVSAAILYFNDKNFWLHLLESSRKKLFSDFRHVIYKIWAINLHVVYKILLTTTDLDTL